MTKILFVCHGNICRSPMAQFIFSDLAKRNGLETKYYCDSKATSTEEIGNSPHLGTVSQMNRHGIPMIPHRASQIRKSDYAEFDYIIGMDRYNLSNIRRITGPDTENKIHSMLDWTENPKDVDDPWYTGDFDTTYKEISEGCQALLDFLERS